MQLVCKNLIRNFTLFMVILMKTAFLYIVFFFFILKGIPFGRRGNRLDLYHSPNVDESIDAAVPLVVFVYGGTWSSGERSTYCLLARQMAEELNAVVICPDYCTYPKVRAASVPNKNVLHICRAEMTGI